MILITVTAAKCCEPGLLQMDTIYRPYLLQFSLYFLSTLFVQDTMLVWTVEIIIGKSFILIDQNILESKKKKKACVWY